MAAIYTAIAIAYFVYQTCSIADSVHSIFFRKGR